MEKKAWSRDQKIAISSVVVGLVAVIIALLAIPQVRAWIGLDPPANADVIVCLQNISRDASPDGSIQGTLNSNVTYGVTITFNLFNKGSKPVTATKAHFEMNQDQNSLPGSGSSGSFDVIFQQNVHANALGSVPITQHINQALIAELPNGPADPLVTLTSQVTWTTGVDEVSGQVFTNIQVGKYANDPNCP